MLRLRDGWCGLAAAEHGYGPGNLVNLLRLLRERAGGALLIGTRITATWGARGDLPARFTSSANSLLRSATE